MDNAPQGVLTVVLDTNVVLDWLVFDDPSVRPLAAALVAGRLRWIVTDRMLDELTHVLGRPELGRWSESAGSALDRARPRLMRVAAPAPDTAPSALRCRDPDDQPFIDLAVAWPARWLVTRDKALLQLARGARRHGVRVCTPALWRFEAGSADR